MSQQSRPLSVSLTDAHIKVLDVMREPHELSRSQTVRMLIEELSDQRLERSEFGFRFMPPAFRRKDKDK